MHIDPEDRDAIAWFVNKLMIDRNSPPKKNHPYGYGTLNAAGKTFIEWAVKYQHPLWSTKSGITVGAMAQRTKAWMQDRSVNSHNKADAHWIAETIKMKYDYEPGMAVPVTPVPTVKADKRSDYARSNITYTTTKDDTPVVLFAKPERAGDLDGLRDLAVSLRRCANITDTELASIMAEAELKVLRLIMERL